MALLCLAGLGACENRHTTGPEAWWHDAIGGKIAAERPPPPGDKDPFPRLTTVPPKPDAPDVAAINRMTAGLIADRIAASHAAAIAPIPPPVPRAAVVPVPSGGGVSGAPAGQGAEPGASASLAATGAATGPAGMVSPPPRPQGPASAPAPARVPAGSPAGSPVEAPAKTPPVAGPVPNGPLPPLPTAEPARPRIAPGPPKPAPTLSAAPPPATPRPADGLVVEFSARSATLDNAAIARVKELAAARGQRGIAVTGYGDARASDPLTQSEALDLALRRAQMLATALTAEGVPNAFLRVNAEAAGRGASLRLLQ